MGRPPIVIGPGEPPRPPGRRERDARDPTLAARFRLLVDGVDLPVSRVEGLGLTADPERLSPPSGREDAWTAPAAPVRLRLIRALDGDRTLYRWRREAADGKPALRDLTIDQMTRDGAPLHRWRASRAWPLAWSGPVFDALAGGLAFESLEAVAADLIWEED